MCLCLILDGEMCEGIGDRSLCGMYSHKGHTYVSMFHIPCVLDREICEEIRDRSLCVMYLHKGHTYACMFAYSVCER